MHIFIIISAIFRNAICIPSMEIAVFEWMEFRSVVSIVITLYCRDRRDGLSKEGCGRVAVLKYTGLVRSYTLECNYNTGCIVNIIPPTQRPLGKHLVQPVLVPPKYTPQIYEEVRAKLWYYSTLNDVN